MMLTKAVPAKFIPRMGRIYVLRDLAEMRAANSGFHAMPTNQHYVVQALKITFAAVNHPGTVEINPVPA
jgi:hypothetical protein